MRIHYDIVPLEHAHAVSKNAVNSCIGMTILACLFGDHFPLKICCSEAESGQWIALLFLACTCSSKHLLVLLGIF